jgi:hypothetical protein
MKKRIIALSVAAAMGGLAGTAAAQPGPAQILQFNPNGVGHVLYVPYFSTQEGNVTAINIINTDTVNGKVLKVRFRGASNSDDLYDFQVFLSPGDVWTAGISKGADGRSRLDTADKSCTLPASVNGAFITGRVSSDGGVNETREGYVEILTMADIVKGADKSNQLALYTATKHVKASAPCTASVMTALTRENASSYMAVPTTGIMASWTIINVQAGNYYAYSADAAAIEAQATYGEPGFGNLVYWDQRSTPLTQAEIEGPDLIGNFVSPYPSGNTVDPLIRDGLISGARYDLPDLSTPYLPNPAFWGFGCPFCQAAALTEAIAATEVAAEFYNEASLGAATDWVVSFPTRRYWVAVDYTDDNALVFTDTSNPWFNDTNMEQGNSANGGQEWQACLKFGTSKLTFYSREEDKSVTDDIVISPGTPTELSICGEVAVLGINVGASTATFGSVSRTNVSNGFKEGWGKLTAPDINYGMPLLARQYTRVANTQSNVFYGLTYPARILGLAFF